MQQILVGIKDRSKIEFLLELLKTLTFIETIEFVSSTGEDNPELVSVNESAEDDDFFEIAGIWAGRDISQQTIREEAWPEQHKTQ